MHIIKQPDILHHAETPPSHLTCAGLNLQLHAARTRDGDLLAALNLRTHAPLPPRPGITAFAADLSGSMAGRPARALRESLDAAITQLHPEEYVSLTTFSSAAHTVVGLRPAREVGPLPILTTGGGTALYQGLYYAASSLDSPNAPRHPAHLRLVVITDGQPSLGEHRPAMIARLGAECAAAGMQVHAVGLNQAYDPGVLLALTTAGQGRLSHAAHPDDLQATLLKLLGQTTTTVASSLTVEGAVFGLDADSQPSALHICAPEERLLLLRPTGPRLTVRWTELNGARHEAVLPFSGGDSQVVQRAAEQAHGARIARRAAEIAARGQAEVSAALLLNYAAQLQRSDAEQATVYRRQIGNSAAPLDAINLTLGLTASAQALSQGLSLA